jgi:thiamine-monophosphate kinase
VSNGAGEFELIDWFRRRAQPHSRLSVGIGDDAAVLTWLRSNEALVTVDMLMQGVHFTIPPATLPQVGRKALAVNLSDIAAMGGRPIAAVVALALPRTHSVAAEFAGAASGDSIGRGLFEGIDELADQFDVAVAGGDTNSWDGPLVVCVTVLGEVAGHGPIRRSDAQVGDWIFVTGSFGGSLAGKHLTFEPRVREALVLQQQIALHAMTDVSDGLSQDLYHILEESSVGAVVFEEAIPISDAAHMASDGRTPLEHALEDGEDFELLFTVAPQDGRQLVTNPPFETKLTWIGEIVAGSGCQLRDRLGRLSLLPRRGWEHSL